MSEPIKHEPIDYFGPGFVMAVILAMGADACALALIGALIPGIGLAFLAFFILVHYMASFAIGFLIFPHLKHLVPKLILLLVMVLPVPGLSFGLFLAVIMQNRLIELLVTQAAILAVGAATGGAGAVVGEVAEAGVIAAEGAEGVATVAKGVEVAGTATKGVEGVSAGSKAAEGAEGTSKGKTALEKFEQFRDNYDQQEDNERNGNNEDEPDESMGELPSERQKMLRENFPDADNMEEQADMVELGENEVDLRKTV